LDFSRNTHSIHCLQIPKAWVSSGCTSQNYSWLPLVAMCTLLSTYFILP
jgi:hypothetical protein